MNRKPPSPTQPGQGIQKIIDLFHELSNLVDKAGKFCASDTAPEMCSIDSQDFDGLTEDAIEEEQKEYMFMINACNLDMTDNIMGHCDISCWHCHNAMVLLNNLIPNFGDRAKAAKNVNSFCALVCLTTHFHASQPNMKTSSKQMPMMHTVMIQADSKLWLQIGSTPVGIQMQDYLLGPACVPIRRSNVASTTILRATSFAQSIMIGMIQCTSCKFFLSLQFPQPLI